MPDYPLGDPRWGFSKPPPDTEQNEKRYKEQPPLWAQIVGTLIGIAILVGVIFPLLWIAGKVVSKGIIELWTLALS